MKAHKHRGRADFRVAGNQDFAVSTVPTAIQMIRRLDVHNGAHGKPIETHTTFNPRIIARLMASSKFE